MQTEVEIILEENILQKNLENLHNNPRYVLGLP